eukprot:127861_1
MAELEDKDETRQQMQGLLANTQTTDKQMKEIEMHYVSKKNEINPVANSPRIEPYIWYIGDDEERELLIDSAIEILLDHQIFNEEIWQNSECVSKIFVDLHFVEVVRKMQAIIAGNEFEIKQHFDNLKQAFTIHSESYLYSFLLVIASTIKYVISEFEATPLYDIHEETNTHTENKELKEDINLLEKTIDKGYLLAPKKQQINRTIKIPKTVNNYENKYRIYQEYVRKFVLEYEHKNLGVELWPWYENTNISFSKINYRFYLETYKNEVLLNDDSFEFKENQEQTPGRAYSKYRYLRKYAAMFFIGENQILTYLWQLKKILFDNELNQGIRLEKNVQTIVEVQMEMNSEFFMSKENRHTIRRMLNDPKNVKQDEKNDDYKDVTQFRNLFVTFPDWWNIDYDRILLELALTYKLNTTKYIDDLDDVFRIVMERDVYEYDKKQFKDWCSEKLNVLHRLRYLLYIMLQDKQPQSVIFLNDKIQLHVPEPFDHDLLHFIEIKKLTAYKSNLIKHKLYTMASLTANLNDLWPMKVRMKFKRALDGKNEDTESVKYWKRDIESELRDIMQLMDPTIYGPQMYGFIMKQMIVKQKDSLWTALNILLKQLSTNVALHLIEKDRDTLMRLGPSKMYDMCRDIIAGSQFPMATSLYLSKYFEKNKNDDPLNEEWTECSKKCQNIAMALISNIESDHLLALLLEAPSDIEQNRSAFRVVLHEKCLNVFGNQRIRDFVTRLWVESRFLDPEVAFKRGDDSFMTTWKRMMTLPARFYLSPGGYYYVSCFLYMIYLIVISSVSLLRIYPYSVMTILEIVLWFIASQFILYEVVEFAKKGVGKYFGNKSGMNQMDAAMSVIWVILFVMRMNIHFEWKNDYYILDAETQQCYPKSSSTSTCSNANYTVFYMAFWALQMIIAWLRMITLLRMGPLLRVISVILVEIYEIILITIIVIVGYMFALYYVAAADEEFDNIFGTAMFCWKMLLGQQEWETLDTDDEFGSSRAWLATTIVVSFTIIVTILVFNVLLSFMVMKFEDLSKDTELEDIFLQAELSYDIIDNGYAMLAPLNGITMVVYGIIQSLNGMIRIFTCFTRKFDQVGWCLSCCDKIFQFNFKYGVDDDDIDDDDIDDNVCCPFTSRNKELHNGKDGYYCKYCHFQMKDEKKKKKKKDIFNRDINIVDKYITLFNNTQDEDDVKIVKGAFGQHGSLCPKCFRPFIIRRRNGPVTDR